MDILSQNYDITFQLFALAQIVIGGPLIIALIALRSQNS